MTLSPAEQVTADFVLWQGGRTAAEIAYIPNGETDAHDVELAEALLESLRAKLLVFTRLDADETRYRLSRSVPAGMAVKMWHRPDGRLVIPAFSMPSQSTYLLLPSPQEMNGRRVRREKVVTKPLQVSPEGDVTASESFYRWLDLGEADGTEPLVVVDG